MGNHISLALVCLAPAASALQTTLRMTMEERAAARQFGFNTGSYMPQKLDHFTAADGRSFDQRYYENKAYWSPRAQPEAPVFLYLGGEAPLYGPPSGFVEELAREFGALVVALEHRYYGKSQPFDEITTDNLAFLSSGQALLDAVAFQRFYCEGLRGAPPCPRRPPAPRPASQPPPSRSLRRRVLFAVDRLRRLVRRRPRRVDSRILSEALPRRSRLQRRRAGARNPAQCGAQFGAIL